MERLRPERIDGITLQMIPADPVLLNEMPVIQKIIEDEMWLEGERRGCAVTPNDCVVRDNVCRIILQIGQQLRESITAALPPGALPPGSTTCG